MQTSTGESEPGSPVLLCPIRSGELKCPGGLARISCSLGICDSVLHYYCPHVYPKRTGASGRTCPKHPVSCLCSLKYSFIMVIMITPMTKLIDCHKPRLSFRPCSPGVHIFYFHVFCVYQYVHYSQIVISSSNILSQERQSSLIFLIVYWLMSQRSRNAMCPKLNSSFSLFDCHYLWNASIPAVQPLETPALVCNWLSIPADFKPTLHPAATVLDLDLINSCLDHFHSLLQLGLDPCLQSRHHLVALGIFLKCILTHLTPYSQPFHDLSLPLTWISSF